MAYCHAAHGVILGNHVICSNSVQLAGDVHVEDWAIIGGCSAAHQFCTVGKHAMVGGMVKIRQDIPPYMLCDMEDNSQKVIGPNVVGNRSQALERVENDVDPTDEVKELVAFYRNSTRGVC